MQANDKHDPWEYTLRNAAFIALAGVAAGAQEAFYKFEVRSSACMHACMLSSAFILVRAGAAQGPELRKLRDSTVCQRGASRSTHFTEAAQSWHAVSQAAGGPAALLQQCSALTQKRLPAGLAPLWQDVPAAGAAPQQAGQTPAVMYAGWLQHMKQASEEGRGCWAPHPAAQH